jgi:hypothetical protein
MISIEDTMGNGAGLHAFIVISLGLGYLNHPTLSIPFFVCLEGRQCNRNQAHVELVWIVGSRAGHRLTTAEEGIGGHRPARCPVRAGGRIGYRIRGFDIASRHLCNALQRSDMPLEHLAPGVRP